MRNEEKKPPGSPRSGARELLENLADAGVEVIFGYPGGAVLTIYDALLESPIRHVLPRHEQSAVHAADAYARVSGRIGVCLATSGPGAANMVTGIANAFMDSIPVLIITGQVSTRLLGTDSFQEVDITGITMPITKHNYLVKQTQDIPRIVREAIHIATTGRPGPVLIDLPRDVLDGEMKPEKSVPAELKSYKFFTKGNPGQIKEAAKALMQSKKPVIYAGGGIITSGADDLLRELAEKTGVPVVTTLNGIGSIQARHPNNLGMVGMHGTTTANLAVHECDLLLAIGVRFDDRVTSGLTKRFAPKAQVLHIDIDPAEIGKVLRPRIPIVGDARLVLADLLPLTAACAIEPWMRTLRQWQDEYPLCYEPDGHLNPQLIMETMGEIGGDDAYVVTDVGQHQMWAAQFYPVMQARHFITSAGLGTMGFGLPAAIGAQIARPDALIYLVTGDGSFQMNVQELATLRQYDLPVKIILMNNGVLGMVRQFQQTFYRERYNEIQLTANPDFIALAAAYGIKGLRVTRPAETAPALREAVSVREPVLLDFAISPDEVVLPMIHPGKVITEMLEGGEGDA
ncbi:MAG: biosynthetic-type acetolactate synthase large subunit [Gracilibacteraceae bacterium]|jgi:acetolactate synthase-1/2/3 large subunit|nr:biosynthetic-type acetolactate synthase large subunit [Gracilibacteraceae bacterium]